MGECGGFGDCPCCRSIPGPDPGACPRCGHWRKAGMLHDCAEAEAADEAERRIMGEALLDALARLEAEPAEVIGWEGP